MSANGKVVTGFSKPYVARYSNSGTTVTFSDGMPYARGVSVSLDVSAADDNKFYADNVSAEDAGGTFGTGSVTLVTDHPLDAARNLVDGLPEAGTDGWTPYGDSQNKPYVAVGYITRYMQDGTTTWVPTVLIKCKNVSISEEASTQEEEIEFQTTESQFSISRSDDANRNWKYVGEDFTSESDAEDALKAKLNIT